MEGRAPEVTLALLLVALLLGAASPDPAVTLADLNARLLAGDSATKTLSDWCREHRLAVDPRITAERVRGEDKPVSAEQRAHLGIDAAEPVRYRHVRLRCGDRVLSEADNWYVPSRLTPAMNAALDGSDIPFGTVVAPLGIGRRTLSAELLWKPEASPAMPAELIRHRAIVRDRDGRPIAVVTETYQAAALDFLAPR